MLHKRFQNKVALITGGSRGIGAAIAKRFAREGCNVAISFVSSEDKARELVSELEKVGVRAIAVQADSADPGEVEKCVKKVGEHFGKIDILVNNAGIYVGGMIDDPHLDIKGLGREMAVNVGGVFAATHAAVTFMGKGGRIINIGSVNGQHSAITGVSGYSATKAALVGYTHGWARDLGARNITVNLIQPGPIDTDMNPDHTDFAQEVKSKVALGRYGKAEEVASVAAFLASDEASYVTGATLTVDGGLLA